MIKQRTGLPFVADFRDAWMQDPVDPFGCVAGTIRAPYGQGRMRVMAWLERYVVKRADVILFTSNLTHEAYRVAYPEVQKKGIVLYNGVEESDFESPSDTSVPFAFTYVGTLHAYQSQQIDLFLRAFALAVRKESGLAASRMRICGQRPTVLDGRIEQLARAAGIDRLVVRQDRVPHSLAVSLMKSRGVLLVFSGASRLVRPSKISDYLAARRPILALAADDSETASHVQGSGHSLYSGDSPEELADIITRLWQWHRNDDAAAGGFPFRHPHPLHWRTTALALAEILDRLTNRPPEPAERALSGDS
jgi:hypothetical protein